MRITKQIQVIKEESLTTDILCNKCGLTCRTDNGPVDIPSGVKPQFDGLLEAKVQGGYFSKKIGDLSRHTFSLCETCFMDLQSTFKIPSYRGDYFGDCPMDYVTDAGDGNGDK